jgi:hypothetical protein
MNCLARKLRIQKSLVGKCSDDYALTTLPLRMQEVHTRMRLVVAPTRACTGRRFTFQRRLVTLWAWLMRFPDCGFLPQISHCCAMTAIHPFTGCKRSHYSTGFCPRRQFAQVWPEKVNWLRALKQNQERIYVESWKYHFGRKRTGLGFDGNSGRSHRRLGHRSGDQSEGCYHYHHRDSLAGRTRASPVRY